MDGASYLQQLDQALRVKIDYMDRVELKQLKDDFKLFQTAYQAVYNVLLRKGLIHEDPYKYELKISEVGTPPEGPFTESEKMDQLCVRLSQFDSYLEFLNNYYQFSVDFLTMGRIKRLAALTKYFNFVQFTENSPHINTRYLAELVTLIRKGSDPLSGGILNESLLQLDKTTKKIFAALKTLTLVHKERYKLELRSRAMAGMEIDRTQAVTHKDDVVRKIRQRFAELAPDKPFYPELAEEVLLEDYSAESDALRDAIIRGLGVAEEKKSQGAEKNFKAIILEGARILVGAGFQLGDAVQKLQDNQVLLESQDRGFMTKVRKALRQMFGRKSEHVVHEVEYIDPVSGERKNDVVDFTELEENAGRRAQSLSAMVSRSSAASKRLEGATEDQAYKFLEKGIEDLQAFYRTFYGLEEFFKGTITDPEFKGRVRSIGVELSSIKNAFIKANQKRHEYIAQKEEVEQMKRLGIRDA
ncbi:MAG: hypothetical protein KBB32_07640 [Spirochaetia bacterium]|nr:hypothetical protein [Spirochaetia bacterium]